MVYQHQLIIEAALAVPRTIPRFPTAWFFYIATILKKSQLRHCTLVSQSLHGQSGSSRIQLSLIGGSL